MILDPTDRRRIIAASALTLVALPALFWASGDDGSPNVATAGIEVRGDAEPASDAGGLASTAGTPAISPDVPTGDSDPVYLSGPQAGGPGAPRVAVPAKPGGTRLTASATFSSTTVDRSTCHVSEGVSTGQQVTVVNLANNRSTECTAMLAPIGDGPMIVMHFDRFVEVADVTDAPIHVEIRT